MTKKLFLLVCVLGFGPIAAIPLFSHNRGLECSPEGCSVTIQYGLTGGFIAMNLGGIIYAFGIKSKIPVCPNGSFTCCNSNLCNTSLSALPVACPLETQSQCLINNQLQDPGLAFTPTALGVGITSSILFASMVSYFITLCGYRYKVLFST